MAASIFALRQIREIRACSCCCTVPAVKKAARWPGSLAACLLLLVLFAGASGPVAWAVEHITLRNGFELDCDHRASIALTGEARSQTVRLFLDASENSYLDVEPGQIASSELVPAAIVPPPGAARPAIAASPGKSTAVRSELSAGELHELLQSAGTEHDLDVDLLASLVHAESGSHVRAVSRTGAQGLMQLMPGTAAQMGVKDSFVPEANVHGGTAYLDGLLKRYHDNLALALAAYNAGPGAVDRYHGIPPYRETRAYVARIIHEFNRRYAERQGAASLAMLKAGAGQASK